VDALDEAERLTGILLDHAMFLHKKIGPGIAESVYEELLLDRLIQAGLRVDRQQPVNLVFENKTYPNAFRYDLLVEGILLIELKSIEAMGPVHVKQVQTYIRLMNLPIGLLLNFGCETLKQGIRKIYNKQWKA
jgi:iron complex transport system substrate-binding protein